MYVLEETWEKLDNFDANVTLKGEGVLAHIASFTGQNGSTWEEDLARAKLAAQAPAMARLLLSSLNKDQWLDMEAFRTAASEVLKAAGVLE